MKKEPSTTVLETIAANFDNATIFALFAFVEDSPIGLKVTRTAKREISQLVGVERQAGESACVVSIKV